MSALIELIRSKKKGVAVDVIDAEESWRDNFKGPSSCETCFRRLQCYNYPHIAGCTIDSMQETELILSELIMSVK